MKQLQERIEELKNEELKQNEMIKDLNTVKLKNENDFIKEVVEIKLQNVELICKLEEIIKERDVLQKDNMKGIQEELQRVQDELRLAKTETSNAQYLMR